MIKLIAIRLSPVMRRIRFLLLLVCVSVAACAGTHAGTSQSYRWTKFVQVQGQPEPVPEEWVSTPQSKFAHSIKIPNPVPKDSGYRPGMTSEQYFEHLCKNEAGEFIFKTVENVEGFYFMRPPKRPTDDDLMDRYKLEAPEIERLFQAVVPRTDERAKLFVSPPWRLYRFVEEPDPAEASHTVLQASGYKANQSPMRVERLPKSESRYGLIWRGIRRFSDREFAIAGSEWIVIDIRTYEVLAVKRDYGRTGGARNTPAGIWWLNSIGCPRSEKPRTLVGAAFGIYDFNAKALKPSFGGK